MIDPAVITLGGVVVLQIAGSAFWAGSVHAQIKSLQSAVLPIAGLGQDLARVEATMQALLRRLPDPDDPPPRRGRRPLTVVEDDR